MKHPHLTKDIVSYCTRWVIARCNICYLLVYSLTCKLVMQLLTQTPPVALEYWLFLYPSFLLVRNQEISPRSNKSTLSNAGKRILNEQLGIMEMNRMATLTRFAPCRKKSLAKSDCCSCYFLCFG